MKTKIIFLLLLASFIFLSAYEREQVSRYAHRYTRLTEGDSLSSKQGNILYDFNQKNSSMLALGFPYFLPRFRGDVIR